MAERDLDFEILRRSRRAEILNVHADADNVPGLQGILRGWLANNRWDEGLWGQFTAVVRYAGEGKVRQRVVP
jgi:hypothetical protein